MENTVFVVLESIIYLNIGYLIAHFSWRLSMECDGYPAKRHPVITRLIWPLTYNLRKPIFLANEFSESNPKEAYYVSMIFFWPFRVAWNALIGIVIVCYLCLKFLIQVITWPTRRLIGTDVKLPDKRNMKSRPS